MVIEWIACAALATGLLAIAVIDIRELRIPNLLSLPLLLLGLAYGAIAGTAGASLLGAAAGYGLLAAIAWLYRRMRGRSGIGMGDAKLLAAGGAWCGWAGLPAILLIASFSGLLFALLSARFRTDPRLPFGPFLALGIAAVFWRSLQIA